MAVPSAGTVMDTTLSDTLKAFGLEEIQPKLSQLGVEKLDDISYLFDNDLLQAGLSLVEVRKLQACQRKGSATASTEGEQDAADASAMHADKRPSAQKRSRKIVARNTKPVASWVQISEEGDYMDVKPMDRTITTERRSTSCFWTHQNQRRPLRLVFVRHGQSEGNLQRSATRGRPAAASMGGGTFRAEEYKPRYPGEYGCKDLTSTDPEKKGMKPPANKPKFRDDPKNPTGKFKAGDELNKQKSGAKRGLEYFCLMASFIFETFPGKIESGDKEKIEKAVQSARGWLDKNPLAEKDDFEAKQKELEGMLNPIPMRTGILALCAVPGCSNLGSCTFLLGERCEDASECVARLSFGPPVPGRPNEE